VYEITVQFVSCVRRCAATVEFSAMWQPQCSDGGGERRDNDRLAAFGHDPAAAAGTQSRYSPVEAMLHGQTSGYAPMPSSSAASMSLQQHHQQHLLSLYDQQLQQQYQQHYQLQQLQQQVSGYAHHNTAARHSSPSPAAPPHQPQPLAPAATAARTTKIPDDQVVNTSF